MSLKEFLVRTGNLCMQLLVGGASPQEAIDETVNLVTNKIKQESEWSLPTLVHASVNWAACGFPCVLPTTKLAASLMATSIAPDVIDSLEVPWQCFVVEVPPNLVTTPTTGSPKLILLLKSNEGEFAGIIFSDHATNIFRARKLSQFLGDIEHATNSPIQDAFDTESANDSTRVTLLCWRLFIGVCAEMSGADAPSRPTSKNPGRKRQSKEPTSWSYVLRRDVTIDVRRHVADYAAGRTRKPVSVQTLVCGHWRNQAHGVGRLLRKLIHIEPAWRGPEDAPIVVRSHKLGLT